MVEKTKILQSKYRNRLKAKITKHENDGWVQSSEIEVKILPIRFLLMTYGYKSIYYVEVKR